MPNGSRGVANPNEFWRDPTEFGQLIYDPLPDYSSSVGIPPWFVAWESKQGGFIHMHVALRRRIVAWDVACIA